MVPEEMESSISIFELYKKITVHLVEVRVCLVR